MLWKPRDAGSFRRMPEGNLLNEQRRKGDQEEECGKKNGGAEKDFVNTAFGAVHVSGTAKNTPKACALLLQ